MNPATESLLSAGRMYSCQAVLMWLRPCWCKCCAVARLIIPAAPRMTGTSRYRDPHKAT